MQTIYLDISNKGVIPTIYAKQGDVGRKFQVALTDSGVPYVPSSGSAFSVWYSGASGEGNYTNIGDKSAFFVNGNKVAVEMIAQMLSNDGDGILSLVLNDPNGNQVSTWNIPYCCESVPGAESEEAKSYYTAFSQAVESLPYPDSSLSVSGKAADAAATGEAIKNITADSLMAMKQAGKRIVMLGDSNAAGLGWYYETSRNETNDGVFAVLREMLPKTTFKNYAVSGAGFAYSSTANTKIEDQIEKIEGTPDVIFVWCGGNDISRYLGGDENMILSAPNMTDFSMDSFDDSLYGKVNKALLTLRKRYPSAKICGVIRTYRQNISINMQRNIYGMLTKLYQKYRCSVINLNDYGQVVDYVTEQAHYWGNDIQHYSEYAYRHLFAPIFYSAICNGLNENTFIPVDTMYFSESANTLEEPLSKLYDLNGIKAGTVIARNVAQANWGLYVGGRVTENNAAAIMIPTRSNNISLVRETDGVEHTCYIDHTEQITSSDVTEGTDVATFPRGRYSFTHQAKALVTGIPFDHECGFILDVMDAASGNKFATIHSWTNNEYWVGTKLTTETSYTWRCVTASRNVTEGVDIATLPQGKYVFTYQAKNASTGVPFEYACGFTMEVSVVNTGSKYAQIHCWEDNSLWLGKMLNTASTYTWNHITGS